MSFVKIPEYAKSKNPEYVSEYDVTIALIDKKDLNLHVKVEADKPCIIWGDIDHCKSKSQIGEIFNVISEHLNIKLKYFRYSISKKPEEKEYGAHWSIPKYHTTIPELKKIFSHEKFDKYKEQDKKLVDTSVYKNGKFRLPYQTEKTKPNIHKIKYDSNADKLTEVEDFLIHKIPEKAKEYKFKHEPEPEPEAKAEAKKDTFKNKEIKLDDIEKMASKLIDKGYFESFEDWCNLGMIINYETNESKEGLNLFDKLSQSLPNYKNSHDVSKQYFTFKKKSKSITVKTLYKWFYEEYPEEKPIKHKTKTLKLEELSDIEKPSEYYEYKKEFELKVFKLKNPLSFCIENKTGLQFLTKNDLITWSEGQCPNINIKINDDYFKCPFIKLWIADTEHRVLEDIIFDPKMPKCNSYNLYKGSVYQIGQACDENNIFFKLLKYISNDDDSYEYFKQWIAHIVKTPYKKTNVAIILFSMIGGIGKNCLTDALCKLFENYSAHLESIEDLTKNFNSHLSNKLFIYGDEISAQAKKISDKLKQIITRPTLNLEKKGVDSISLDDYSNYIFTTNNENSFKLDTQDRRFFMIRCPDIPLDKQDYTDFYEFINNKDYMNQLYNYFMTYENTSYNVGFGRAPETQYKNEIILDNAPAYKKFIYTNIYKLVGRRHTSQDLNIMATEYAKNNYMSCNWTLTRFGIEIKSILQPYFIRNNGSKYDLRNTNAEELRKHLYSHDKDYYNYINDIPLGDTPSFSDVVEDEDDN